MKYLAIDIGQVICNLDFTNFNKKLASFAGISEDQAYDFLVRSQKSHDLGLSTLERDLVDKAYGFNVSKDQLIDLMQEWNLTVKANPIVIDWLNKLLADGVNVAILSNIGTEHAALIKTILGPIYKHHNVIKFFSCGVGARKPTYVYYNTFLAMYEDYRGCVYMDDNTENISAGNLFRFDSTLFDLSKMTDDEIKLKLIEIEGKIK